MTAACAHCRVSRQNGFDLAQLDAEAADLDLVVGAAKESSVAVRPPASQVAGAVQRARRVIAGDRRRSARPSAPGGSDSRAPGPAPPMYSSPATPTGAGCSVRIEHVDACVRDWPADRNRALAGLDLGERRPEGCLGRAVKVPDSVLLPSVRADPLK